MREFRLEREAVIDRGIDDVFAFFSDPANLEVITPPWLRFRIVECPAGPLEQGSRIRYRLRVRGFPIGWTSLISRWQPPFEFVDEQLRGPYTKWVHTHTFEERDGQTWMRDRVDYAVLGGWLVNALMVRRDLDRIFDYRAAQLRACLGAVRS